MWRELIGAGALLAVALVSASVTEASQVRQSPTFRSAIDLVRVSAVVRDRKGRFVPNLTSSDFQILDDGSPRMITEFRRDFSGISIALLFDVSGSMQLNLPNAREAATHLLSWLDQSDQAAIFTFDTRLDEVVPFTAGLKALPEALSSIVPFGATSLDDAIAQTARRAAEREGRRRAVVVFTDGNDNASRLTPGQVSAIASAIDVPVYIFGAVPGVDNPTAENSTVNGRSSLTGPMSDLAEWTGGHVFITSTPAARSAAARQIVDELRHQYLIAFESSGKPGWHPLVVHARDKDLVVRARSGYLAGQSRPNSN